MSWIDLRDEAPHVRISLALGAGADPFHPATPAALLPPERRSRRAAVARVRFEPWRGTLRARVEPLALLDASRAVSRVVEADEHIRVVHQRRVAQGERHRLGELARYHAEEEMRRDTSSWTVVDVVPLAEVSVGELVAVPGLDSALCWVVGIVAGPACYSPSDRELDWSVER